VCDGLLSVAFDFDLDLDSDVVHSHTYSVVTIVIPSEARDLGFAYAIDAVSSTLR
jgi:hypothetical protein